MLRHRAFAAPAAAAAVMSAGQATMSFQPDLFDDHHRGEAQPRSARRRTDAPPDTAGFSDAELLAKLEEANPRDIERVCSEVLSRSLADAVPLLESLWRRFAGFGITKPFREQVCALRTLAGLDHGSARAALKDIILSEGLPASLHGVAVQAAAAARLTVPSEFLQPSLEHSDPDVRAAAFRLSHQAGLPADLLRAGLGDPSAAVRREAAIALGLLGLADARTFLLDELERQPSDTLIMALAAIGDEDAIVHLGRCAAAHPAHADLVADLLEEMDDPKALTVAARLREGPKKR